MEDKIQHRSSNLKDLPALGSVPEGQELEGVDLQKRKSRWKTLSQPSLSLNGQALVGASSKIFHLPH